MAPSPHILGGSAFVAIAGPDHQAGGAGVLSRRLRRSRLMCDHLYDSTSRYDTVSKLLTFLLVCPVCRIEKIVETLEYEPNFIPGVAGGAAVGR